MLPDNSVTTPWQADPKRRGRVIVGALSVLVSSGYFVMALQMPLGQLAQPGPGMWPRTVGIVWIVISVIVILEALLSREVSGDLDLPRGRELREVLMFLGATVGYILLIPILGQYIAAPLYAIVLLVAHSPLVWWRSVVYGLVIGVSISWLFIQVLQIPMPSGLFFTFRF